MAWLTNRAAWRLAPVQRVLRVGMVLVAVDGGVSWSQGWRHALGIGLAVALSVGAVALVSVYANRYVRDPAPEG